MVPIEAEDLRSLSRAEEEGSLDTPRTEDFEEAFASTIVKPAPRQPGASNSRVTGDTGRC